MILHIIIVICIFILYVYLNRGQRSTHLQGSKKIPVEKGLPVLGVVTKLEKPLCNYLVKLGRKHGPIYMMKFGMRDVVVLNTFDFIKTALVDNGDALSGRWKCFKDVLGTKGLGIIFIDGHIWSQQRSFVLRTLKDFGLGRSRSLEIVLNECFTLLEDLEGFKEKKVDFAKFISIYTANVISKFVMNKRFEHGDREFQIIEKCLSTMATNDDPVSNLCFMFPFIENNEWLLELVLWITSRNSLLDECHGLFEKEVKEHLYKLDSTSEGEDLMDIFLIKQRQKRKVNNVETFTDFQLVRNALELFGAGYDTTAAVLEWSFVFMSMFPEVQSRVSQEIIDQTGHERMVTMTDKPHLNYTQAVMDEILRLSSVTPLGLFHRTLADVNVHGYFIPKDTIVIPNLFACHLDPNVWQKPNEFYPEHFLTTDESGNMKYKPKEELIPFSMGKRQCIAESLARMEYFVFYTNIVRLFQVSLVGGNVEFDVFSSNKGLIRTPNIQDLVFTKRRKTS